MSYCVDGESSRELFYHIVITQKETNDTNFPGEKDYTSLPLTSLVLYNELHTLKSFGYLLIHDSTR
jgi:hypothetical protein